ncbi:DapH/DapD/GlmU-related protein [Adhaeribacter arboris]|nr:DapH/DapD/GlmU-related protein [Adhaeribacter arboris]
MADLDSNYSVINNVAIHKTAVVESTAVLKAPIIIGKNCFVGANAYLRGGVYLTEYVTVGTGCEIKSSIIFPHSAVAHFNFIGDSIIGSYVNFEAGSITANHHNDRVDKQISVVHNSILLKTGTEKFGALVGDHSKIGANAVLSPGTLLPPNTIVKRLELIEQKLY